MDGIIRLIAKWLTAGVLEEDRLIVTEEGTPQGAGYADDTIVGFDHRHEAERFLADLKARLARALLARRGIVMQRQLEFGTLEAIFGWVSAGLGISLLRRALIGGVCGAGQVSVHELTRADTMVDAVFIRRRAGFAFERATRVSC